MDLSEAANYIAKALQCELKENDDEFIYNVSIRDWNKSHKINKVAFQQTLESFSRKKSHKTTWISDAHSVEFLVQKENWGPSFLLRTEKYSFEDPDLGLNYSASLCSDEYILFVLQDAFSNGNNDGRRSRLFYPHNTRYLSETGEDLGAFELLRRLLRMTTVSITSQNACTLHQLSSYSNSFLFQIAFNTDTVLVPQSELPSISNKPRQHGHLRRKKIDNLDVPRRTYSEELTHHYLLALSSDSPIVAYLSYYHVIEHFYEEVFNEDLTNKIQEHITSPDFSYRSKDDIAALLKLVGKSYKVQRDEIVFSEDRALFLTLHKYVNVPNLIKDLEGLDEKNVEYFSKTSIDFANAPAIDFRSSSEDSILKNITKRVYATRNALVHSKRGAKSRYRPFYDDEILNKELILLRLIAEQIIVNNSIVH